MTIKKDITGKNLPVISYICKGENFSPLYDQIQSGLLTSWE